MDLTTNIQRLVEEICYMSEGFGSIDRAISFAKERQVNLNYHIPDHMWPDVELEIEELMANQ